MALRCPRCYGRDFYGTGETHAADVFVCRECGYAGPFIDLEDESIVPKLRNHIGLPPEADDTTEFSRSVIIALAVLVALFLCLMVITLGPHP